jgi:uncharacterized protein YcfL
MKKIIILVLGIFLLIGCSISEDPSRSEKSESFRGTMTESENIKFLFKEHYNEFYEVTIDGEKYIWIWSKYNFTNTITKK